MKPLLAAVLVLAACSKRESSFKSNFADVRITGGQIVSAKSNQPFAGKLVARDQEITIVAKELLGQPTFERVSDADLTGLVVVVAVDNGVPSGRAEIRIDLYAPKLNPEVARRSHEALSLARAKSSSIKLAEATFAAGKLDGPALVFEPDAKGNPTKVAEVQFKDHVIHGTAIELDRNTHQKKRELHFESGVQTGPQRWFYPDGKLEREATFVAGVPDGEVKEHYASGKARARRTYAHGKPIGTHEGWYPNGQRAFEIVYAGDEPPRETSWFSNGEQGIPNGTIEEFYASGALRTRTSYVEGTKHGAFEQFYETGQKWKAGQHEHGTRVGRYQEWWKNGQPALDATYLGGQLDGDYKRWYASGKPWETATYVAGKRVGPYRKWWKNGKPAHVYAYNQAGRLDGEYKQLYDNGAKWVVATYADGKPQGKIERWFRDGKLGYVMNHMNGRPDGEYKRWYANGKPRLEATHVGGHLDGELKNWNEDGTVYEFATYQRGVKIQTTRPQP